MRLSVAEELREAGFTVLEAAHADEASTILAGQAAFIGVVVTDVQMPGSMDGVALTRLIHARYPAIRVIVLSGAPARMLTGPQADATFTKPHDPKRLRRPDPSPLLRGRTDNGSRSRECRTPVSGSLKA